MAMIAFILNQLIGLYIFVILVTVVMSWLIGFNVINRHNRAVDAIWRTGNALTEPVMAPVRRLLPNLGGVDISPVIVLVVLQAINGYIIRPLM
jgi:YggT family protein